MNNRLQRVVDRLIVDENFLKRFQRNPEVALRPYGLSATEVEAVKRGEAAELAQLGVDLKPFFTDRPAPSRMVWLSSTYGRRAVALLGALVLALGVSLASPGTVHAGKRARHQRARALRGFMKRMVRRAGTQTEIRAGLYLRRRVRHLGLRYVRDGGQDQPIKPCGCEAID